MAEIQAPFDSRLSKLERQGSVAKIAGSTGDPSAILKALEELEQNVKEECDRQYARLDKFEAIAPKVEDQGESLIAVFKRVTGLEAKNEEMTKQMKDMGDVAEVNRKNIKSQGQSIEKLKQKIDDLEAMGSMGVSGTFENVPMPSGGSSGQDNNQLMMYIKKTN